MTVSQARRPKELKCESARLRQAVYDLILGKCRCRSNLDPFVPCRFEHSMQHSLEIWRCAWVAEDARDDSIWKMSTGSSSSLESGPWRRVGTTRKTGFRWRKERGGIAPVRLLDEERSTRYLMLLERQRIATLRSCGELLRAIARALGRSP